MKQLTPSLVLAKVGLSSIHELHDEIRNPQSTEHKRLLLLVQAIIGRVNTGANTFDDARNLDYAAARLNRGDRHVR